MNVKCREINNDVINNLKQDLCKYIKLSDIQTYFPIMSMFFDFYNESDKEFIFNSKFFIKNINNVTNKNSDGYIKHFVDANIIDLQTNKSFEKNIFIKVLPILNVIKYMMNDYELDYNPKLPNIFGASVSKKLNLNNNSAYIDPFFSLLASKLVENGKCPCFPLFYGTFSAIADEFKHNITEDFSSIKKTSWYEEFVDNKFKIIDVEIPKDEQINSELIKNSLDIENEIDNISEILEDDYLEEDIKFIDLKDIDFKKKSHDNFDFNTDTISLDSSSSSQFDDVIKYCVIENFPVQLNCIEKLNGTLDDYIEETNNNISDMEWKSILFQVCFGLSVAQKHFDFCHNDLHSSNIMFRDTKLEYLYYKFKGKIFKVPTFGKISKIIDFGRATFTYKKQLFFSDVFRKEGDAEGQYSYPYNNSLKDCKIKPNKSFDLSRLATTIIEHHSEGSDIYRLLKLWCMDKYGNFLKELDDDFNLYKIIAKNVVSAIPKDQINKIIFKEFLIDNKDLPSSEFVYTY